MIYLRAAKHSVLAVLAAACLAASLTACSGAIPTGTPTSVPGKVQPSQGDGPPTLTESSPVPSTFTPGQIAATPAASPTAVGAEAAAATLVLLVERLAAADQAMQNAQRASDLVAAQRGAQTVLDLVTGPGGRHAGPNAISPGILPADGPSITDPGLALAAYDASENPRVRQPIQSVILGEASRWRHPAQRWDEIDAAVAGWTPQHNPMPDLDGHIMRAVGWSLLILRARQLERAREFAGHGTLHTGLSLQAAREALEAAGRRE